MRPITTVLLSVLAAASAPAQQPAPAPAPAQQGAPTSDTMTTPAAPAPTLTTVLGSRVRQLMVAEESYFADHMTYTRDLAALGFPRPATPAAARRDSVTLTVTAANDRGWSATISHRAWPGRSCVVYVGTVPAVPATMRSHRRPAADARPVCDEP